MKHRLFYGKPENYQYDTILDLFSGSKINSIRTSTVPLVQYWKKTDKRIQTLTEKLNLNSNGFELCFEYPTASFGRNKSSMTDLMLLSGETKIAIEAKFTEYVKASPQLLKEWKTKGNSENRIKVLNRWKELIQRFTYSFNEQIFKK